MFRSAASLALVLAHVAPHFGPRAEAAEHLSRLGVRYHIDPLLIVADAEHESAWDPAAVNRSSGTLGLTQIQPKNFCECRDNPVGKPCSDIRGLLLYWRANLSIIASYFEQARSYCQEHEHTGLAIYWLQIPRGDDWFRHARCGHRRGRPLPVPTAVRELLAHRAELEKMR